MLEPYNDISPAFLLITCFKTSSDRRNSGTVNHHTIKLYILHVFTYHLLYDISAVNKYLQIYAF